LLAAKPRRRRKTPHQVRRCPLPVWSKSTAEASRFQRSRPANNGGRFGNQSGLLQNQPHLVQSFPQVANFLIYVSVITQNDW
jgi:hypothetical protein